MTETNLKMYEGEAINVTWNKDLCIHVAECGNADDELFVSDRDPWCDPDEVTLERVVEVVERCPSGALTYTRQDGILEERQSKNTVHVACHGPLYFKGQLEIDGATAPGVKYRAALCRCGASGNKPFCDGSHIEENFDDYGAVGQSGDGIAVLGGPLQVNCVKNGPLMVKGNLEIYAGSGRQAWQGTKAALCRCGSSSNKPFCDGSHKDVNFKS